MGMTQTGPVPTERLLQFTDGRYRLTDAGMLIVTGVAVHHGVPGELAEAEAMYLTLLATAEARGFTGITELAHELQAVQALDGRAPWLETVSWSLLRLAEEAVAYAGPDGVQAATRWLAAGNCARRSGQAGRLQ